MASSPPTTMSGARPNALSSPIAVLVLLPDALSANVPGRTKIAPPSMSSRTSGSAVPRLSGLTTWTTSAENDDDSSDPLIVQSRRLSLAPHLGTGQSNKAALSPFSSGPSPTSHSPGISPLSSMSSIDKPAAPGPSRRTGFAPRKSSIPEHIASSPALSKPRASVAYPSGQGLLPNSMGRRRANTEGDELVDLFRASGVEGEYRLFSHSSSRRLPSDLHFVSSGVRRLSEPRNTRPPHAPVSRRSAIVTLGLNRSGHDIDLNADAVAGVPRIFRYALDLVADTPAVAVIRHLTHLPNVIADPEERSTSLSTPGATANVQQVVLVPLGDAPPLPSLSLFLAQGTTPSAVCFQQDLLDRARKVEEAFLTTALDRIKQVKDVIQQQIGSDEQPVILGYLAQGSLSQSAIGECLDAGAGGVLHPPYDNRTVLFLKQLVHAANEGTSSTVALLGSPTTSALQSSPMTEDDGKVILTPTALSMGAEHESEKILSASFSSQRRRKSTQTSLNRVISGSSTGSAAFSALSSDITQERAEATSAPSRPPHSALPEFGFPAQLNKILGTTQSASEAARRRSVDTGGLALAFDRASKKMETIDQSGESGDDSSEHINVVAGDHEQELADGSSTTQFAEVLGEMYNQTMMSIDVQMIEYDK